MTKISDIYELTSKAETSGIEKAIAATEKLDKAQEDLGDNAQKSGADFTRLNRAVELGTKAFGVAKEVIDQTLGRTLELANGIDGLSQNLGISAEEASKLTYATSLVGVEQGQLEAAMVGAIKKGITPNLEGLGKLADEYNGIEDPIKRSQFLMETFGKQGLAMGDLIERGADGIQALSKEAEIYGVILDDAAIEKTKEFNIELKKLESAADKMKVAVGMAVVETANKTVDYYETISRESQAASEQETKLRQAIVASAFVYGQDSQQVKMLSAALTDYLYQQQQVASAYDVEDERSKRSADDSVRLAQIKRDEAAAYYGSREGLQAYYEGMVAANTVTSDADIATRQLALGTQDLTKAFIFQQATQKLAPEAALQLGVAMGIVKKETLETVQALDAARKAADSNMDGFIDAGEAARGYTRDIDEIARAAAALQGMKAEVTITTINEYVDRYNKEFNAEMRPTRGGAQGGGESVANTMRNRGVR